MTLNSLNPKIEKVAIFIFAGLLSAAIYGAGYYVGQLETKLSVYKEQLNKCQDLMKVDLDSYYSKKIDIPRNVKN